MLARFTLPVQSLMHIGVYHSIKISARHGLFPSYLHPCHYRNTNEHYGQLLQDGGMRLPSSQALVPASPASQSLAAPCSGIFPFLPGRSLDPPDSLILSSLPS